MIISAILFVLLGTLPFKPVTAAYIDYEPIKITVNENFNAQPGQIIQESPTLNSGFVHQGANFYFKPQLNLPPGYLPSHVETLISSIRQNTEPCKKDTAELVLGTDKIIEIIKPLDGLMDFTKETFSETVVEKEKNIEIVKPLENGLSELVVIPEETKKGVFVEEVNISEVSTPSFEVIIDDNSSELVVEKNKVTEILKPIDEPLTQETLVIEPLENLPELVVIPEVITAKEILVEELKITEGSTPIELIVDQNLELLPPPPSPLTPIISNEKPKPVITELVMIPEAPVLPPLSLDILQLQVIPHVSVEEVKIEVPVLLEDSIEVLAPISEPIKVPEITLENIPSFVVEEEVKIEEPVLLEGSVGEFPQIPEISTGQFEKSIEVLSPILEPIKVSKIILENTPSFVVEDELKIEEQELLEGYIEEFPQIPEIFTGQFEESIEVLSPILEPVKVSEITLENTPSFAVEEEVKIKEPVLLEGSIGELHQIPEISIGQLESTELLYPILEPIRVPEIKANIPYVIFKEDVKIGEPIIFEGATVGFPPIPEIFTGPISKPEITNSFVLENMLPVFEEEIRVKESIDVFPPIADISTGPILESIKVPKTTNLFELEDSQQKPCEKCVITIKENLPPAFIPKPPKKQGVFTYLPIPSYLSNRIQTKAKEFVTPKLTSLKHILHKNNPFRLPQIPFSKLPLNTIMTPNFGKNKMIQFSTSRAHNIVQSRIAPHNMIFRKKTPKHVKIHIGYNFPKIPS